MLQRGTGRQRAAAAAAAADAVRLCVSLIGPCGIGLHRVPGVADVPVILKARVPPHNFETLRAVDDAIVVLKQAGVKAALAMGDDDNARNLRWEAGACLCSLLAHAPHRDFC